MKKVGIEAARVVKDEHVVRHSRNTARLSADELNDSIDHADSLSGEPKT
jgi:hypothetical protein